ncbi:MAG: cation transporter [Deltaproteobacteria bacterium]|nr:cation transporter [Deltaproteobacteria bacterium]
MDATEIDACCSTGCEGLTPDLRPEQVGRALRLEYLTVGWNVVEGVIAVTAALLAGSVALLGFGIDSFVECASGLVMIWRLRAERAHRLTEAQLEATEHRARRLVALSLFVLAAYVTGDAALTFWRGERPLFSAVGVGLTSVSLVVMLWLARAKRRVAAELGSRAMEADAFQTTACWWLSLAALIGVGLNGIFGWSWADPLAAFVISGLIVKEGREAWAGERDCC